MEVIEKRKQQKKEKWTWSDTAFLLVAALIIGLVVFIAVKGYQFFYDIIDDKNYTYQLENSGVISYDMKFKKNSSFLSPDDYFIYVENENGQTKILSDYDLYVEKGDNNELVEIEEKTQKGRYRQTDYVLILDKDNYAAFNREYAKIFSKETRQYDNKKLLEKEILK